MTERASVAVVGGSGFYELAGIGELTEVTVDTPYGAPSDTIVVGSLADRRVAFLPRHARGHRLLPSEVPNRANIYALKTLGVERVIGVSAVGSMREDIHPLEIVVPDQYFDRTRSRASTFFGQGLVGHVAFAEPVCPELLSVLANAGERNEARVHVGGTYICIEGPQFSTKAESRIYRQWGVDVIGMTALPEARLAREAEMCYATLALVTDYDVWHESGEQVSVELVLHNLGRNVETARAIVRSAVESLPRRGACNCGSALATALVTPPGLVPPATRARLGPLVDKYYP